jgi:hypothetical protein
MARCSLAGRSVRRRGQHLHAEIPIAVLMQLLQHVHRELRFAGA